MVHTREQRAYPVEDLKFELRSDVSAPTTIQGYAALFGVRTTIETFFGGFTESIRKGAFKSSIERKLNVRSLFNHDASLLLGTTRSGSLILREDDKGLWTETVPSQDTSVGRDVVEWIRRGEITGMSFAFIIKKQEWTRGGKGELDHREIIDLDLFDISPVTYPAYEQTSVGLRKAADDIHKEARSAWEASLAPEPPRGLFPGVLLKRVALLRKRRAA